MQSKHPDCFNIIVKDIGTHNYISCPMLISFEPEIEIVEHKLSFLMFMLKLEMQLRS